MIRILVFLLFLSMSSCIGDDIIEDFIQPEIRVTNPIDTLQKGTEYQFQYSYFNNVGQIQQVSAEWSSSDPAVININSSGLARALEAGEANLRVYFNDGENESEDEITVVVGDNTSSIDQRSGTIQTTSGYTLQGDFTLTQNGDDLDLEVADNWVASSTLPGLYVYLSNNPNSIADALEISEVTIFSGAHSYSIPSTGLNDYDYLLYFCKPFNVKVGHGTIN